MAGWRESALCRQVDTELFFSDNHGDQRRAKGVCAGCCVRMQCLDFAIVALSHGVAGGLTAHERTKLRRAQRRSERVTRKGRPVRVAVAKASTAAQLARELGISERQAQRYRAEVMAG